MGNTGIATLDFGNAPVEKIADGSFLGGGIDIGLDTFAQNGTNIQNVASTTINLTIAANSNRAILILLLTDNGPAGAGSNPAKTVSGITGCGAAWSKLGSFSIDHSTGGNGAWNLEAWIGLNPSTGAQTATITLSGTNTNDVFAVGYSLYNVHQTTPLLFYNGGLVTAVAYNLSDNIYTISTDSRTRAFHAGMFVNSSSALNKNVRASGSGDNLADDFDHNVGSGCFVGSGAGHGFYGHFGDARAGMSWLQNTGSAEDYGQVIALRSATGDLDNWAADASPAGSGVVWTPAGALFYNDGVLRGQTIFIDQTLQYLLHVEWRGYAGNVNLLIEVIDSGGAPFAVYSKTVVVTPSDRGRVEAVIDGVLFGGGFLPQGYVQITQIGDTSSRVIVSAVSFATFITKKIASVPIVGEAGILSNSAVEAFLFGGDSTPDHGTDEHQVENLTLKARDIIAGTGFTIVGESKRGPTYGQFKVRWAWV